MNRSIIVLAGSTLVFGSASAYFWQAQRAGDERNDALELRVKELETQLAAAQPLPPVPLAQISPVIAPPAATDAAAPSRPAARAPALATASKPAPTAATMPAIRGFAGPAAAFRTVRMDKLMQDPEYREAMRTQHRMMMSSRYPDLGEALNLQPDQIDKLMDLLTDQEIEGMSRQPPFAQDGQLPDQAAMQEWSKQVQQRQRQNEAQIAGLLGDAGVQEWKEYQQTLGARMQVKQLRGMMEGSSEPIRADQVEQLVDALAAEQSRATQAQMQSMRNRMGAQRPMVAFSDPSQGNPANRLAMIEQSLEQMVQNNQRTHDAVAPYLSSRQLEQFDRYQNQQLEMQRASMRMMRAQAEAEARGDIPTNNGMPMGISSALVPLNP